MSRALVTISPASGRSGGPAARERLISAIDAALLRRGLTAEHAVTTSAEDAAAVLRAAPAAGYELAVVAGGDGTVRLAVASLATTGLPLGIVPLGTGNILAATLGITRDPLAAAARLAEATPMTIDTGVLTAGHHREPFAVAAGAGLDARVMASTASSTKARFGVLAYFATVMGMIASLPVSDTEIVADGEIYRLPTVAVLVANCGQILPGLLGPRSPLDPTDGLLDVVAIRGGASLASLPATAGSAIHSLLHTDSGPDRPSLRLQASRIKVKTSPPEPIQVDGDLLTIEDGEFEATIVPHSLTVLV